jgi:hypothetical protein
MVYPTSISPKEFMRDVLALSVTLGLQEDKPSTHQDVLVDVGFMSGGQMDKTQYKNAFNTGTRQAMHREVMSSLTSVSDLSLNESIRKT